MLNEEDINITSPPPGDIGGLVAVSQHSSSARFYIHNNHRGDVLHTRDGTTAVTSYHYNAFGQLLATTGTDLSRFKFSSKERDASTGLLYYGYRFYAPQWQRWVSRDPSSAGSDRIKAILLSLTCG